MQLISKDREWHIYKHKKGYIVHNTNYEFETAHTHIKNLKTANDVVLMCKLNKAPQHWPVYLLTSIQRVATPKHSIKVARLIQVKKSKSNQSYYFKSKVR